MVELNEPVARGALSGCLVADFSRVLAGPLATMLLGDLGATVVKVEHPRGDDSRAWGPPFMGSESTYYLSINRNKRSVVLDLSTAQGVSDAHQLAQRATVLVENFRPGRLAEFGLGYEQLAPVNPGLVYCSVSGFGGAGTPGAHLAGYDFVVQAMSGLMDVTGPAGGPPTKVGVAVVDVLTGLYAAVGILAALGARRDHGRGQHVEVNLMSSALASLVNQASAYLNTGTIPHAMGNRHPSVVPYETFTTKDGVLAIAAANDGQFRTLCRAVGDEGLADDLRFATNAARVAHRSELAELLEAQLAARPASAWVESFRAVGVPCGPVNDVAEAFAAAKRLGLEEVVEQAGSEGVVRTVASPVGLSASPVTYRRPPPTLGLDTDEVVAWLRTPSPPAPLDPV